MNQQFFDERLGVPPVSTIDLDDIIVRQRRRSVRRRTAAIGSAALASVAAVAVAISLAAGPGPGRSPAPLMAGASASSTGTFAIRVDTPEQRQQTLDQLQAALENALSSVAPGVNWVYMPDVPGEQPGPDGHPQMHVSASPPVGFSARSGLATQGVKGGFFLRLAKPGCVDKGTGVSVCNPLTECDKSKVDCNQTQTAGGLRLTTWTERTTQGGQHYVFYGAEVVTRTGHALNVQAVNYFGGDAFPVSAPAPVLTPSQVAALVTDVAAKIVE